MNKVSVIRVAAPIVAAGTVFLAGKALRAGYSVATGSEPPKPDDPDVPIARVIVFAVAAAGVTAVITVSIQRGAAKAALRVEREEAAAALA